MNADAGVPKLVLCTALAACAVAPRVSDSAVSTPDLAVRYRISSSLAGTPPHLLVSMLVTGLPREASDAVVAVQDWGEWRSAPFEYVRRPFVEDAPASIDERGRIAVDADALADGSFRVTYELRVYALDSGEHGQRSLLPYRAGGYVFGFTANTLATLEIDGKAIEADVEITVDGSSGPMIFTGWGGWSSGSQTAVAPNPATSNGLFALGTPIACAVGTVGATSVEVGQFSDGPDATGVVLDTVLSVLPVFEAATGRKAPPTIRLFVDSRSGGGTHTECGIRIGGDASESYVTSPGFRELIAHEVFHIWLGRYVKEEEEESLVWFKEGFTDYISLWTCAATGVTTRDHFAERLLRAAAVAHERSSLGTIAFAEAGVDWRDDDGPNERMAYDGGALLAFALDARLRDQHGESVAGVVREILRTGRPTYDVGDIRGAVVRLGAAEFYDEFIAGTSVPDARPLLRTLGFTDVEEPKALTYLGMEARYVGPADARSSVPAVITDLDPDGPAARAGFRVGDRILGFEPLRSVPPELTAEAPGQYRFGLTLIASGASTATFDVERDGEERWIEIEPILVHGGRSRGLNWDPDADDAFFKLP